ncbi:hypothetical protein ANO11243_035010 [Dothideomycetidae sp. 11243]|nr:hypothetical protein ANO11243_035010 [fungal sp. No.11243]
MRGVQHDDDHYDCNDDTDRAARATPNSVPLVPRRALPLCRRHIVHSAAHIVEGRVHRHPASEGDIVLEVAVQLSQFRCRGFLRNCGALSRTRPLPSIKSVEEKERQTVKAAGVGAGAGHAVKFITFRLEHQASCRQGCTRRPLLPVQSQHAPAAITDRSAASWPMKLGRDFR